MAPLAVSLPLEFLAVAVTVTVLYFVFQKRISRLLERWSHLPRVARK